MEEINNLNIPCSGLEDFPYIEQDFDSLTEYQMICKTNEKIDDVIEETNTEFTNVETELKNKASTTYVDEGDSNTLETANQYTDAKTTIILVDTKGKEASKEDILKWGKNVSVWYDEEFSKKYKLKEGFLVILPVIIKGTSTKVGILGTVIQITPKLMQVQGSLVIEDYSGNQAESDSSVLNVEIVKDGFGNYTADYNDNDINNAANSGKLVQAKYTDDTTNQTFTYYYSTMNADRRPSFNRTFIENNKMVQIIATVDHNKKVTIERKEV